MPRNIRIAVILSLLGIASYVIADDAGEEVKRFQGNWRITDLIDNGRAVAPDLIKNWLPSGGQVEIVDNTILFTSPLDDKKRAKVFSVDPAVYPKRISIATEGKLEGWGIYRFDQDRVILCLSDPAATPQPDDFSARAGSNRMLMVLEPANSVKPSATAGNPSAVAAGNPPGVSVGSPPASSGVTPLELPNPPAEVASAPGVAARVLTDAEVTAMLRGRWKLEDSLGALYVTFEPNGTFVTFREVLDANTFHRVFVQTPTSNGNWSIREGQLQAQVTGSVQISRVNQVLTFAIRSISEKDLLFVDPFGRVGKAIRVP